MRDFIQRKINEIEVINEKYSNLSLFEQRSLAKSLSLYTCSMNMLVQYRSLMKRKFENNIQATKKTHVFFEPQMLWKIYESTCESKWIFVSAPNCRQYFYDVVIYEIAIGNDFTMMNNQSKKVPWK